VKLVSFHLMPYRPLDLEEAARYRSPWVVLPNRLYDPVKGAEEYARHIDALVYAEDLGFDAIGVNEHHQTAYGLMPAHSFSARAGFRSLCWAVPYRSRITRFTLPKSSRCWT